MLLALAGLPGLVMLVIVLASIRLVGPARRTKRVFASVLVKDARLSKVQVEQIHREILEME